jgi:hypothetical membrane protein
MLACGFAGPIIYASTVFILGLLWPGYNHVTQFMSELGSSGAPHAFIMNTIGFQLLGLLLIVFSLGLHREIKPGSVLSPILIASSGLGLILTGALQCDPGCINVTLTGRLHSYSAILAALAMIFAVLSISPRIEGKYRVYSYSTGLITAVISIAYILPIFKAWEGAIQRLGMAIPLLWIQVISIRLLRSR